MTSRSLESARPRAGEPRTVPVEGRRNSVGGPEPRTAGIRKPKPATTPEVLLLQRTAGNAAVSSVLRAPRAAPPGVSRPNVEAVDRPVVQRRVHEGQDHAGRYELDDQKCSLTYHQNWFFTFQSRQTSAERQSYMASAKRQVEDTWSKRFPLVPSGASCSCRSGGIEVSIVLHTFARDREGSHGFSVVVSPSEERGFTTQPTRTLDLGDEHRSPVETGFPGGQQRVAHEFGHTVGLTDEYHWWAGLFGTEGSRDTASIMNLGDEIRPRHYQHFADLVNLDLGGSCTYLPGGESLPEHENPVNQWRGIPITTLHQNADFFIGLTFDRRVSNQAVLGLAYPTAGAMSIWNPTNRSVRTGPTVGLRLNQLAHPLYANLRTGLLFDPAEPQIPVNLGLPISADLGIRGRGFQAGVNYTVIADLLGSGKWTHLVGVGLKIDLP